MFLYKRCVYFTLILSALGLVQCIADETVSVESDDTVSNSSVSYPEVEPFDIDYDYISDVIVVIDCGNSQASGFLLEMDGRKYIVTNQHVIMGHDRISFKTLTGKQLKPYRVEISKRLDLARIEVESEDALKIGSIKHINEEIVALGNSQGAGVITPLYGVVNGIGPDTLEITAEIVGGNSGGPILNTDMEVIGVATYLIKYDGDGAGAEGTKWERITRRFALKLDEPDWIGVNWKKYNEDYGKKIVDIEYFIDNLYEVIIQWIDHPDVTIEIKPFYETDKKNWIRYHNSMAKKIQRFNLDQYVTKKEMRRQNNVVKTEFMDSGSMLSELCLNKARYIGFIQKTGKMSDYLNDEFERKRRSLEGFADVVMKWASLKASKNYWKFID